MKHLILYILIVSSMGSCTTTSLIKYYGKNKMILDDIEKDYTTAYTRKPFSLEFSDRALKDISIEIMTDGIRLIYNFNRDEHKINDTLKKYNLNQKDIQHLLDDMRSIGCIWLDKLDYYVDGKKQLLVFMSIRQKKFHIPLTKRKYYILTYFEQPQYFDSSGTLLNKRKQKIARKIHGDVFKRITDKVAYTVSNRFR